MVLSTCISFFRRVGLISTEIEAQIILRTCISLFSFLSIGAGCGLMGFASWNATMWLIGRLNCRTTLSTYGRGEVLTMHVFMPNLLMTSKISSSPYALFSSFSSRKKKLKIIPTMYVEKNKSS